MNFASLTTADLFSILEDTTAQWQGYDNGDSVAAYQGRQMEKYAAAMILVAREMYSGSQIMTPEQVGTVFYEYMRKMLNPVMVDGESGTSRFCIEIAINQWKTMFPSRI